MSLARALSALLPARRISTRAADLEVAAGDESACGPVRPQAVAWRLSTEEVSRVVCYASAHAVPITARGQVRAWRAIRFRYAAGLCSICHAWMRLLRSIRKTCRSVSSPALSISG